VDCLFLSDPDWTEHHLSCLWGACQMLPPSQILHWMESEWRAEHRFQKVNYSDASISPEQFDAKVQAAMMHRFGVSVRLTELRPDLRQRLRRHLEIYRQRIRPLLSDGVLFPLNEQPLRDGRGNRWPAFQLTSADDHLVGAFRLPPATSWQPVRPQGLDAPGRYTVSVLDLDGGESDLRGETLMAEGIPLPTGCSTLVLLTRTG
jgi:alpha-galactosidase